MLLADQMPTEPIVPPGSLSVIYAYSDTHQDHTGWLKVGDTTLNTSKAPEDITQEELEAAARRRINTYTKTGDMEYKLELAVLGVRTRKGQTESFRDYKVHSVLQNMGFTKKKTRQDKKNSEWFEVDSATVLAAIEAVKNFEPTAEVPAGTQTIVFREEQETAIRETLKVFKGGTAENPRRMLWNAKMRFGKTLTSYGLLDRMTAEEPKRVLIVTHRPDVNSAWQEDFTVFAMKNKGWKYGSKRAGLTWDEVSDAEKLIWFASIQDLRGSHKAAIPDENSVSDEAFLDVVKNEELFETEWDVVITDEAHEGSLTELAKRMFKALKGKYFLDLSGTPFNIINTEAWDDQELADRFTYDGKYHWSYLDERKAKQAWEERIAAGEEAGANPYASLPEMHFITYNVSSCFEGLEEIVKTNNSVPTVSFTELFRTRTKDGVPVFVNEEAVLDLLAKMRGDKKYSTDPALFPFHRNFENYFNHSLWMMPNVPACVAMENLLKLQTSGFAGFGVINATGLGSTSWGDDRDALAAVHRATTEYEHTITLSYRMLNTGVTVKPWTAVLMLSNMSSPMAYMQTAFRGASPGLLPDGRIKEHAYVFDFNPDRCLSMVVELAKSNAKPADKTGTSSQRTEDEASINEHLEHLSLLSLEGAKFIKPDAEAIIEKLNEAYVNEIIEKGFDSPRLWDNKELRAFDIERVKILEALRKLQGGPDKGAVKVPISEMSDDERETLKQLKEKLKEDGKLGPEEKGELKELESKSEKEKKEAKKNRDNAVSILAGIAARMPMLVYASPADQKITPENFAELIDDESWKEFMPKNLLKESPAGLKPLTQRADVLEAEGKILYWDDVRRFFDDTIFSLACERIRRLARLIDEKEPIERAFRTAALFSTFKNPDKETVLTPFRVVNMQYGMTMGGLQFIDIENSTPTHVLAHMKNKETGALETHEMGHAIRLLDAESHSLAPQWKDFPDEVVADEEASFWKSRKTTIFDINSKTALYPLYAAASLFYAKKYLSDGYRGKRIAPLSEVEDSAQGWTQEDRDSWQRIVEDQIFVNCRVPYSAKIAQRVLTGYNDYAVAVSVVDVLEVRSKLKEVRLSKGEGKKGTRPLADEEEVLLWCSIFNPEALRNGMTESLVKELLMADDENMEVLLKQLEEQDSSSFSAVVSNPPYQLTGETNSIQVYPRFYEIGSKITRLLCMIFPKGWQTSTGGTSASILHKEMRADRSLCYVDNYNENKDSLVTLFPGIGTGGVSIVMRDRDGKSTETVEFREYGVFVDNRDLTRLELWSSKTQSIFDKVQEWSNAHSVETMKAKIWKADPFSFQTNYTTNANGPAFAYVKEEEFEGSLRVWARDKSGSGYRFYWFPRDYPALRLKVIDQWKLIWPEAGTYFSYRRTKILKPGEISSGTFTGVNFSSEEEVGNFKTYFCTLFYRFLLTERATNQHGLSRFHEYVPDLTFTTNPRTGLKGWQSEWTDADLKILFKDLLTEEDWIYIEKTAIQSDPTSLRKVR